MSCLAMKCVCGVCVCVSFCLSVFARARARAQVAVRTGGTFTLAPDSHMRPCLFIAGGIGITALSSMILHLAELCQGDKETHVPPLLMYSGDAGGVLASFSRANSCCMLHHATLLHIGCCGCS